MLPTSTTMQLKTSGRYPLITNSPDTGEASSDRNHDNGDDGGDPSTKQPCTDKYDIALSAIEVPRTYAEAMASHDEAKWKKAIRSEIESHTRNRTWNMVTRQHGLKVIECNLDFSVKPDETGKIIRYKYHLVARGFLRPCGRLFGDLRTCSDARFILSMELDNNIDSGVMVLKKQQLIAKLLDRFGQCDANPVRDPLVIGQYLS
ncbi:hypothetical protein PsorP6_017345 [Peronosclerospora sorghi]|uniref:Uncharacterized protein n=1 Tax=Peronosclerospora sorghi TaxID=230839 RepID=A0ACC0WLU9_9STRA|nr:hypothetical protein PsorP6_017345 [Peronosclerospora sorghi]